MASNMKKDKFLLNIFIMPKTKLSFNARPTSNCPRKNDKDLQSKMFYFKVVGVDKRKWTSVQKLAASVKIKLSIQMFRAV